MMFKILDEACTPTRATKYSAMVDLYARESVVIGAGETKIVPLGVKIDIKRDTLDMFDNYKDCVEDFGDYYDDLERRFKQSHFIELHPRSSLRAKGLIIGVGICDLDYPDELGLIVHNPIVGVDSFVENKDGDIHNDYVGVGCGKFFTINKGDKVAQITLKEHKGYLLGIESDTERSGGFGSTGM